MADTTRDPRLSIAASVLCGAATTRQAWKNVPCTRGSRAEWDSKARATQFPVLLKGDAPYLFASEHMSFIDGWQEGAVRSAHKVLGDIAERMGG